MDKIRLFKEISLQTTHDVSTRVSVSHFFLSLNCSVRLAIKKAPRRFLSKSVPLPQTPQLRPMFPSFRDITLETKGRDSGPYCYGNNVVAMFGLWKGQTAILQRLHPPDSWLRKPNWRGCCSALSLSLSRSVTSCLPTLHCSCWRVRAVVVRVW